MSAFAPRHISSGGRSCFNNVSRRVLLPSPFLALGRKTMVSLKDGVATFNPGSGQQKKRQKGSYGSLCFTARAVFKCTACLGQRQRDGFLYGVECLIARAVVKSISGLGRETSQA